MTLRGWGPALCLVILLATATVTLASKTHYDSKVTIKSNPPVWHGRVTSDVAKCERNRTVQLYYTPAGGDPVEQGQPVKTDSEGRWRVELVGNDYFAKVFKKVKQTYVCKADVSKTVQG